MTEFRFPGSWWGLSDPGLRPPTHSVADLLAGRVLDPQVAALFWALLSRRASLLVVGGYARGEGKTTTLTALLGFLPAGTKPVVTRGRHEDFSFVHEDHPDCTYLLAPEFSDHMPAYLWGESAARLWRLTEEGYRFAGTMHATSIEDVVGQLTSPSVGLTTAEIARCLQLAVFQNAERDGRRVLRRITGANWIQPVDRGPGGLGAKSLVAWNPVRDAWTLFSSPDTWADLALWAGTQPGALRDEVSARAAYLEHLQAGTAHDFERVRDRLLAFPA